MHLTSIIHTLLYIEFIQLCYDIVMFVIISRKVKKVGLLLFSAELCSKILFVLLRITNKCNN
jgi:hypothetical protein